MINPDMYGNYLPVGDEWRMGIWFAIGKEIQIWNPFESFVGRWFFEKESWIDEIAKREQ